MDKLRRYLRKRIKTLEDAKIFYSKWRDKYKQKIPFRPYTFITLRAMAGYCDEMVTGKEYKGYYIDHKYGTTLYFLEHKYYKKMVLKTGKV